jgi:hypothetical protein
MAMLVVIEPMNISSQVVPVKFCKSVVG